MAACKGVLPMATSSLVPLPQPDQPGLFNPTRALGGGLSPLPPDASSRGSIDPDIAEVYFLVMHFLASGPCTRAFGQLWNELLQHKLLPRRFHAWYARDRKNSGNEDDDGLSLPLSYTDIVTRHPHVEPGHLVKLLQQLLVYNQRSVAALEPAHSRIPTAADVPTLLGAGAFSLLDLERSQASKDVSRWTRQLRWPHWEADQVHGLMLRELGGGFARHHRAPSLRTASYVVTKPAVLVDRIQIIKKLRGHRNAVYCAIFDRTGQYVITGSDDRLVKIWSTETGLCLRSCRGHEGDITDLAVSSGNTLVASASNDYSIRVWQLPNGVPISLLRGHTASVTAISFSPRQGCEHLLLSTSDDGTCRIWNAKNSSLNSRVYMPNPKDAPATSRAVGAPTPVGPPNNQVLCGAFNADGTIFVTGSSDKMARVWDARKWNDDVTGRPNYELDTLKGHENDVNYVQFSGCAAPSRPWVGDMSKEDHHFKNSWSAHDSIVTCSRDGSAIIWTPRTRKYHGKVGRWQKAYHLRVPPPPMPPQPPRGNGPRHRVLPTPLGVNMIVWSLDNRFVLAAIMDHRICVWNAVDGSLVHSLTGHDKQTYVLDVHPFNPRIAMSAGYDGRVIIWDIWEGHPIKVYDTGEYNLVDGNFSPDGSSLVVSDEVGQIYIFGTGPGMAQKDVKYDQFFLGDFRPLVRDTFGNVLDAETQLPPHQRNIQDLLCDANLIPYPEPYQSLYQQRRLGALGIEWTPSNVFLSIGTTDDAAYTNPSNPPLALPLPIVPPSPVQQNRRGPQTAPGNQWVEQPSEVDEAMDWEQEVAGLSEDTGSDYSASEESRSEEAGGNQGGGDSHEEEAFGSEEEGWEERDSHTHLRRSGRNKRKAEEYIQTASGRRVRRRTFNDDDSRERRPRHIPRASRPGPSTARAVQDPPSARPRRQAARNALTLFTSINSICDEEDENTTTQAPSQTQSTPTAVSVQVDIVPVSVIENPVSVEQAVESQAAPLAIAELPEHVLQIREDATTSNPEAPENPGDCKRPRSQRRLIVKLRSNDHKVPLLDSVGYPPKAYTDMSHEEKRKWERKKVKAIKCAQGSNSSDHEDELHGSSCLHNAGTSDPALQAAQNSQEADEDGEEANNGGACYEEMPTRTHEWTESGEKESDDETMGHHNQKVAQRGKLDLYTRQATSSKESDDESMEASVQSMGHKNQKVQGKLASYTRQVTSKWPQQSTGNGSSRNRREHESQSAPLRSNGEMSVKTSNHASSALDSSRSMATPSILSEHKDFSLPSTRQKRSTVQNKQWRGELSSERSLRLHQVVKVEKSLSQSSSEKPPKTFVRSQRIPKQEVTGSIIRRNLKCEYGSPDRLKSSAHARRGHNEAENRKAVEIGPVASNSRTRGQRRGRQSGKAGSRNMELMSWLLMEEVEPGTQFIPQYGDQVVYLRQGHEDFLEKAKLDEKGPWKTLKQPIAAVEYCRIKGLDYLIEQGTGKTNCKVSLEFNDPESQVYGKSFKLTLPELTDQPDFLVERNRYDASIQMGWRVRDHCKVWWAKEDDEGKGGSWWDGRIKLIRPTSSEFPDSPWESFHVTYKESSEPTPHSPWELFDKECKISGYNIPQIDPSLKESLLSIIRSMTDNSCRETKFGLIQHQKDSQNAEFMNRIALPLSFDIISARVERDYYHCVEALEHDVHLLVTNTKLFHGKDSNMVKLGSRKCLFTKFECFLGSNYHKSNCRSL
ncbi:unnamed protein product [Sphagnum jensenii]|uniref:Bromo domain-containing protein n=1 Tax=Sphagnum jensenii TaxID=128206 RepID=A0ABP1B217_9BRYO